MYWLISNGSNSATQYTPKLRHIPIYCCWCALFSHAYNSILEIFNIWFICIPCCNLSRFPSCPMINNQCFHRSKAMSLRILHTFMSIPRCVSTSPHRSDHNHSLEVMLLDRPRPCSGGLEHILTSRYTGLSSSIPLGTKKGHSYYSPSPSQKDESIKI